MYYPSPLYTFTERIQLFCTGVTDWLEYIVFVQQLLDATNQIFHMDTTQCLPGNREAMKIRITTREAYDAPDSNDWHCYPTTPFEALLYINAVAMLLSTVVLGIVIQTSLRSRKSYQKLLKAREQTLLTRSLCSRDLGYSLSTQYPHDSPHLAT